MLGRDYIEHCSKVSDVFAFVNLSFGFLFIVINPFIFTLYYIHNDNIEFLNHFILLA